MTLPTLMKLPYVSIDIETTGLDPEKHQILEFAAVYDDWWMHPVCCLPTFHRLIKHETIIGQPYALSMHSELLRKIALATDAPICTIDELAAEFAEWLNNRWPIEKRVTVAGKNFAGFDYQFLKQHSFDHFFHHRTLDPAMLYWQPEDEVLPDLQTCMKRAGFDGLVMHTAMDDAFAVVRLLREAKS